MQDQLSEILFYLKGTLKYKWVAIIVAWIVCLGGWLFISGMPNKYMSEAKVHVETRTMLAPLLGDLAIHTDVRALLRVMQQLMFTKENLEQIIKLSELEKGLKGDSERETLLASLKKDIHITGGSEDIFNISYEDINPVKAKNVVQAVLTVFSEQTKMNQMSGADEAQRFLDEQIKEHEIRLKNAEKAKEEFTRINLNRGLLGGEPGGSVADVQGVNKQLEDAKLELNEVLSRKKVLQEQLDEIKATDGWDIPDVTGELPEEDERILALNAKKKDLLARFTTSHPEIISINKTIAAIKKEKQKETTEKNPVDESLIPPPLSPGIIKNPYVQTIVVALNEANTQVAAVNARVDELKQRKDHIGKELDNRLRAETEFQNLNRDYEQIKINYAELIKSRESAKMSKDVDDQAEALKFKIADAPNTPLKPASPKRKLLFSAVLAGGIILGFGVAFLLYFIRPTIMSTAQLRQLTGLPVLGSVSMKSTPGKTAKNKKDFLRYSAAALGLVLVYAGLMTVDILEIKALSLSHLLQSIN
jgi:polysaccharide chain length determinant protein (PEP-CTERM system associated)